MVEQERSQFGNRLRSLREAAGLTQEQLAERAGLTATAIASLERGRRRRPYPHTLKAPSDALGLSEEERAQLHGAAAYPASAPGVQNLQHTALPVVPTPLIGRGREVAELGRLLGENRLVTMTGPGGVGKSRLALEIASHVSQNFSHGAVFIALAPLGDAALVLPTVAQSMGLREAGGQQPLDLLRSYLHGKQLLLVLDNFEHVLDASADVAELLASCPHLAVLATSRAPLRIRGEQEYPVGPLSLPDLNQLPNPRDVVETDAGQLLVDLAHSSSPAFELTQANAAAVAAICRRLDGLPLALELATARLRALGPTELLARLDRVLPLLSGGPRDLPERQRTMRRASEWSYDLLDETGQSAFRRLSVFAGGWDLASAEAVGATGKDARGDMLDSLSSLVEQSLVVPETSEDGSNRYRMLEPVREYALERLESSGEAEDTYWRHATVYRALAEEAGAGLSGPEQMEWLRRLETQHDNLRAAMSWLLEQADADPGEWSNQVLGFAAALQRFWEVRGHLSEGRRWLEAALAKASSDPSPERAKALTGVGVLAMRQGEYAQAGRLLDEGLATACELGAKEVTAMTGTAPLSREVGA